MPTTHSIPSPPSNNLNEEFTKISNIKLVTSTRAVQLQLASMKQQLKRTESIVIKITLIKA